MHSGVISAAHILGKSNTEATSSLDYPDDPEETSGIKTSEKNPATVTLGQNFDPL